MQQTPLIDSWPLNGHPLSHHNEPMMNVWYDGAHDTSNSQDQSPEMRRRQAGGPSRQTCCAAIIAAVFALILLAMILGGLVGGLLSRSTTSHAPTKTTTTTSTTTTAWFCNNSCVNQSWISSSNLMADWLFDGDLIDQTGTFNGTPVDSPSFITNGYVNQALSLNASRNQSMYTSYIPLANSSFTVQAWLYPTGYPNIKDHSILGLCLSRTTSMCLHLTIRNSSSSYYLYMGFMNNDCSSSHTVPLNTWTHAAFVFDVTTLKQSVYMNGVLDRGCTALLPIMVTTGNVTIGIIPVLAGTTDINVFQGYMDQFMVSTRAKSACEVLEDATLAARFPFDSGSILNDYGPNSVSTVGSSYSLLSSGHSNQAISFSGASSSYFQASGFAAFGINNQAYSLSLWVQPQSLSGSLVHISTLPNGTGAWCLSILGFASNSTLVAQVYNGGLGSIIAPSLLSLSPWWSHVVQTWSSVNGLRLYVNNVLVASQSTLTTFTGTGTSFNYVTLANGLSAPGRCWAGAIGVLGPFQGAIDDFRVFSRELSAADVCTLYST